MAKTKINIDQDSIKQFFIDHGEKMLFGAAVAVVALFVWMGLGTPMFDDTTPGELYRVAAEDANRYINQTDSWEKLDPYRDADVQAADRIKNDAGKLDPNAYAFGPITGSILATLGKRSDPELFPPQKLRTEFLRTQIATKVPNPNSPEHDMLEKINSLPDAKTPEGDPVAGIDGIMRYLLFAYRPESLNQSQQTAITYDVVAGSAVLPYEQQLQEYRDKFRNSEGWHVRRDMPKYLYLQIQRSDDGGQTWRDMNRRIDNYKKLFPEPAKEIVDPKYLPESEQQEMIAAPVPALLSLDYRDVAGHPDVEYAKIIENKEEEETEKTSIFKFDADETDSAGDSQKLSDKKYPDYRLARFFDPTPKEVGKTYQYRIRAWVADPNRNESSVVSLSQEDGKSKGPDRMEGGEAMFGGNNDNRENAGDNKESGDVVTDRFGDDPTADQPIGPLDETMLTEAVRQRLKSQRDDYPEGMETALRDRAIPTPWSEISSVTIPRNYSRVYAGTVDAPSSMSLGGVEFVNEEQLPTANLVVVTKPDQLDVSVPLQREDVYAGTVLNFRSIARFLHPISWDVKELDADSLQGGDSESDDRRGVFYQTDALLVDLMGGQKLPFSSSRWGVFSMPSELLVMDPTGRLIVKNELDDAIDYRLSTFQDDLPEPDEEYKKKQQEEEEEDTPDRDTPDRSSSG